MTSRILENQTLLRSSVKLSFLHTIKFDLLRTKIRTVFVDNVWKERYEIYRIKKSSFTEKQKLRHLESWPIYSFCNQQRSMSFDIFLFGQEIQKYFQNSKSNHGEKFELFAKHLAASDFIKIKTAEHGNKNHFSSATATMGDENSLNNQKNFNGKHFFANNSGQGSIVLNFCCDCIDFEESICWDTFSFFYNFRMMLGHLLVFMSNN